LRSLDYTTRSSPEYAIDCVLAETAIAIDVRSPLEFAQGAIPGSINLPILFDEERHQVGTAYKKLGQDSAIELGHRLVNEHSTFPKSVRVDSWIAAIQGGSKSGEKPVLWCWRGGLRSQIAESWLKERGIQVERVRGGYKAIRAHLLENLTAKRQWNLILGSTGSGKTQFLHAIAKNGFATLDLEKCAHHRGSAFGSYRDPQPAQATFENQLCIDLGIIQVSSVVFVEDENPQIGTVRCPNALVDQWAQSEGIVIRASLPERVQNIFEEYVLNSTNQQELVQGVAKLQKRLGRENSQKIIAQLRQALEQDEIHKVSVDHHAGWITQLLGTYYDPRYAFDLKRKDRRIRFEGNHQECLQYIQTQFASQKP
jgi:tRNA 2-selenouridine synthase